MQKRTAPPETPIIPFHPDWVLYQDADIVVVNKPSGLLSVPGRYADPQANLIAQLSNTFGEIHAVHRLDMDTSGIMVLARNKEAHRALSIQFQERLPRKTYYAICAGTPSQSAGRVGLPMRCDWENRPLQMVDFKQGKHADTRWKVTKQLAHAFVVELTPITGRSHQLRLHCKMLGHPILGDNLYADSTSLEASNRLLLHAATLQIQHPNSLNTMDFQCPIDLEQFLQTT